MVYLVIIQNVFLNVMNKIVNKFKIVFYMETLDNKDVFLDSYKQSI